MVGVGLKPALSLYNANPTPYYYPSFQRLRSTSVVNLSLYGEKCGENVAILGIASLVLSVYSGYRKAMDVFISERNLAHIKRKIESGKYSSTDEVLASALTLLDEHDAELESEFADLRESVRRGTEQADVGQVVPAGEVFDELRQRNASLAKPGR